MSRRHGRPLWPYLWLARWIGNRRGLRGFGPRVAGAVAHHGDGPGVIRSGADLERGHDGCAVAYRLAVLRRRRVADDLLAELRQKRQKRRLVV